MAFGLMGAAHRMIVHEEGEMMRKWKWRRFSELRTRGVDNEVAAPPTVAVGEVLSGTYSGFWALRLELRIQASAYH